MYGKLHIAICMHLDISIYLSSWYLYIEMKYISGRARTQTVDHTHACYAIARLYYICPLGIFLALLLQGVQVCRSIARSIGVV